MPRRIRKFYLDWFNSVYFCGAHSFSQTVQNLFAGGIGSATFDWSRSDKQVPDQRLSHNWVFFGLEHHLYADWYCQEADGRRVGKQNIRHFLVLV